jgi:hypothetical protein
VSAYGILFGDIHNHNAHGYGVGSIERSIDVARTHLDFFAFTGHSSWHDMVPMEGGRENHWLRGFERLKDTWPRVQGAIAAANEDDAFCSFLGFEWHSSRFGDQCVVFPGDHRPLYYCDSIEALRRFCGEERALMIPHHLAYPRGRRGVNWDVFDESCTPVVEIFSEHGNSEDDRGPLPMVTHSFGGRESANTVRAALGRGLRFGFVASSDNHAGFPGAYGEGLMGALVTAFTREAILEAVRARRTYALTGDRIEVEFTVDGSVMGSSMTAGARAEASYAVRGRDELDVVELIQDGVVVQRSHPQQRITMADAFAAPVQVRLEWGWGPWSALALDRITDWHFDIAISNGRIGRAFPCLQSGPFDENRRHRVVRHGERRVAMRSYTSRNGAYRENPNQSLILELQAAADAELVVTMHTPVEMTTHTSLARLFEQSANFAVGPFPQESFQWHRLVPRGASAVTDRCVLDVPTAQSNVYLRVRQANGHMAWASPVFLNYR